MRENPGGDTPSGFFNAKMACNAYQVSANSYQLLLLWAGEMHDERMDLWGC